MVLLINLNPNYQLDTQIKASNYVININFENLPDIFFFNLNIKTITSKSTNYYFFSNSAELRLKTSQIVKKNPEFFKFFHFLRNLTFTSFFISNNIDIPLCFANIKSLKSKLILLQLSKFVNLLTLSGKRFKYQKLITSAFDDFKLNILFLNRIITNPLLFYHIYYSNPFKFLIKIEEWIQKLKKTKNEQKSNENQTNSQVSHKKKKFDPKVIPISYYWFIANTFVFSYEYEYEIGSSLSINFGLGLNFFGYKLVLEFEQSGVYLNFCNNAKFKTVLTNINLFYKNKKSDEMMEFKIDDAGKTVLTKNFNNFVIHKLLTKTLLIFIFYVYKVPKNIKKFSRKKSGEYLLIWKYVPFYKRIKTTIKFISKYVNFIEARSFKNKLRELFELLNAPVLDNFLWKTRNYVYSYIFKNHRKQLIHSFKIVR